MQELFKINEKISLEPALYIISTPIGNIKDITIRAIETFKNLDVIFCEDTRVTNKLLNLLSIESKKLFIYNDHNKESDRQKIIKFIQDGYSVGLCSDAGTPLISDPGYKIVLECQKNNIKIVPIPGVSAAITAISISGIPTDNFLFYGFLSQKQNERKKELQNLKNREETLIFYESPKRLISTLENMLEIFGNRDVCIARELTKSHESFKMIKVNEAIDYYKINDIFLKGEIVIVIHGSEEEVNNNSIDEDLKSILKTTRSKEAVELISSKYNIKKKEVYKKILEIKKEE